MCTTREESAIDTSEFDQTKQSGVKIETKTEEYAHNFYIGCIVTYSSAFMFDENVSVLFCCLANNDDVS